jgi:hypothetical protein
MNKVCLLIFISIFNFVYTQNLSYAKDIEPIVATHCIACHKNEGSAPFSLQNYKSVKNMAQMMLHVTETGYMPPWKANPNFSHFANERIMPKEQIQVIKEWIEQGMPKGSNIEKKLKSTQAITKDLGKPDLILKMPEQLKLKGNNVDQFFCYKIPFEIDASHAVKAIEFVPNNKKRVHHASYQVLETAQNAPISNPPYYFEYNDSTSSHPDNEKDFKFLNLTTANEGKEPEVKFHSGWLPGTSIQRFPEGVGFELPQKGVLLLRNLHYSADPLNGSDQSEVRIWYSKTPLKRKVLFAAFKPKNLDPIIKKDSIKTYFMTLKIGADMSILCMNPHMHKLGKKYKAYAVKPNGDTLRLVEILDWDFNWQEFYRFKTIIKIPKGSMLNIEAVYDNTKENMKNPNNPPIDVFFEKGRMDDDKEEMLRTSFLFLPYHEGDEFISLEND